MMNRTSNILSRFGTHGIKLNISFGKWEKLVNVYSEIENDKMLAFQVQKVDMGAISN